MRYLLDTNALSEVKKPRPNPGLMSFVRSTGETDHFLSVVTLGELVRGAALLDPGRYRADLEHWIAFVESSYGDRILTVDRDTAKIWAEIEVRRSRAGRPISTTDALIAATALRHGMTLITRNTADFEHTGVPLLNPWT